MVGQLTLMGGFMKRRIVAIMMLIVALTVFVGCASTKAEKTGYTVSEDASLKKADTDKTAAKKILGKDDIPMPDWVSGRNISTEDVHYTVGMSDYPVERIAIKKAADDARNQMAEWINTTVKESSSGYLSAAGSGDTVTTESYESVYSQKAEAVLSACTREGTWVSKDGTAYVLMSIPVVNVIDQFGINVKKSNNINTAASDADAARQEALKNL